MMMKNVRSAALLVLCLVLAQQAMGHGSMTPEGDICILQIGYLKAHFKTYLPRSHGHEQFCEDLPEASEAVFVMEYEHDSLADMLIEFRIIHERSGKREFTREKDIEKIDDLESITVAYHPPRRELDVFSITHQFEEPGWYVGIITARTLALDETYVAVFPFEVGFTGYRYWPLVAFAIALLGSALYYDSLRERSA
ncbi:MAG: hypothetical protein HOB98_20955 [Gammaproteobacteria bacterium]|jgi:hypothetical protein|nr:hypothetical protein [Gammaproteobacteria bacterium]MBT4618906.1 hypothetical protein [Gammaproteobacteria bacterium]MBT6667566.1 hypothetical protein [Gammaproteobacteria bacterium]MBT6952220.1 hypothetical protein [Gammaproteobacteria bacterium]MBT7177151.1 hypothetical protein [Gammaproteobacteria bacterium]